MPQTRFFSLFVYYFVAELCTSEEPARGGSTRAAMEGHQLSKWARTISTLLGFAVLRRRTNTLRSPITSLLAVIVCSRPRAPSHGYVLASCVACAVAESALGADSALAGDDWLAPGGVADVFTAALLDAAALVCTQQTFFALVRMATEFTTTPAVEDDSERVQPSAPTTPPAEHSELNGVDLVVDLLRPPERLPALARRRTAAEHALVTRRRMASALVVEARRRSPEIGERVRVTDMYYWGDDAATKEFPALFLGARGARVVVQFEDGAVTTVPHEHVQRVAPPAAA